jgi:DNA-binding NarL/FixJ family response regulator
LAARLKPDLILMDLGQGEMNGLEATRLLKGLPGACRVVLLSGNAGSAYYDAATAAGADSFISKTDIYEHLVPLIQQMFR